MLTVSLSTNTLEVVALNNTLKSFSFRSCHCIEEVAFYEYICTADLFSELSELFELISDVAEFNHSFLRRCVSLFEMALHRLAFILLFLFAESELKSLIAIRLHVLHLGDYARAGLNDGDSEILPVCGKNACHSYFTSNYSRHG